MTVANLQHHVSHESGDDPVETAPAVIQRLLDHLGKSRYAVAEEKGIDLTNVRRAARNFSRGDAEKLLELISEESIRRDFEFRFHQAELLRKSRRFQGAPLTPEGFEQVNARMLFNEDNRGQSRRTGSKSDYWSTMLFRLQLSSGDEPVLANARTLRGLYAKYVAEVRIAQGESPAFRNALILMRAYLATSPFGTIEQRHALLGISYIAIDLAAQINDYRSLRRIAKTLSGLGHARFVLPTERAILNRLIVDTESRANRYSPEFDYDYRIRRQTEAWAFAAVEDAAFALRTIGDLAFSWPELTAAWLGSYFGLLNYGIAVGWPPERLKEMFKHHDDFAVSLGAVIGTHATLLTNITDDAAANNPYSAEFLATMAILRKNPSRSRPPRGAAYKNTFDPDKALAITQQALELVDPSDHYGDSIVGCLRLVRAEALLCKAGPPLTPSLRDEYETIRLAAAQMFRRLGMPRKLLRLDKLGLGAGIIRST